MDVGALVKLDKTKKNFIEIVGRIMNRWGYTYTDGLVYGILLLNGKPVEISEIVKLVKVSRSAVSTSLNKLARDYLVTISKKGKTKLFSPVPAFLKLFLEQPKELLERDIIPLKNLTKEMLEHENNGDQKEALRRVMEELNMLEKFLRRIIELEEEI